MTPSISECTKGAIQRENGRTILREQQKNLSHQMVKIVRQNQELQTKLHAAEYSVDRAVQKILELNCLVLHKQEILRNQVEELMESYHTIRELEASLRNQQAFIDDLRQHNDLLQRISATQIKSLKAENESLKNCVSILNDENARQRAWIQQLEQMASTKNWIVSIRQDRQ